MFGFQAEIAPQLYPAMRIYLFIIRLVWYSGTLVQCDCVTSYNHNRILMRVIRRLTAPAPDQARLPTSDPLEPADLAETARNSGLELTWSWACWPTQRWSHRWWGCSTGHSASSASTCIANIFSHFSNIFSHFSNIFSHFFSFKNQNIWYPSIN